ncbi:MAG: lipase maturation factor family protein, partial [Myxococcota bacterium]
VAPHQPRLDWQMWFAALRGCRRSPWFASFAARLLGGSPTVLDLLEHDPFEGQPPRYLRSRVYSYRFAPPETRRRTGQWWQREGPLGRYCPVFTLEDGRLQVASPG